MQISKEFISSKLVINKNRRKCFIFDLDGTIIFNNQFLSKDVEELLLKIKDEGHEIIFATGRPLREFKNVMPLWAHVHPLGLFSGVVSYHKDNLIRSNEIDSNHLSHIAEFCEANKHPFIMDSLTHYYHPHMDNMVFGFLADTKKEFHISDMSKFINNEVYKVWVFDMEAHDYFSDYSKTNGLLIKHHSYDKCFDIVPLECNKYISVLPFIGEFTNEDIFAFGNDYNDYELFKHFNNSVLFGNVEELQKITKLNIHYDEDLRANFEVLIKTILG